MVVAVIVIAARGLLGVFFFYVLAVAAREVSRLAAMFSFLPRVGHFHVLLGSSMHSMPAAFLGALFDSFFVAVVPCALPFFVAAFRTRDVVPFLASVVVDVPIPFVVP